MVPCLSTLSIQRSKHALNAMFVETVDTTLKTHPHIPAHNFLNIQWIFNPQKSFGKLRLRALQPYHQYYICRHCRYKTRISNAFNTIFVNTVDTKHIHTFPTHNFLNIQRIFQSANSFGKLRLRTFQPYHKYYICRYCWYKTRISNAFNAIYVDTVDTKHIHTFLPITFLIFNGFSIRK